MNPGEIYLNDFLLPAAGRKFSEGDIEKTRSERMASGRYVEEILWRKKKFAISYELLKGEDIENIVTIWQSGEFPTLKYANRDGSVSEYVVKFAPLDRQRMTILGPWLWEGVTLQFEEV